jgi:hypothetical protein
MSCIPNRTSPNTEKRIGANGGKYQARFKNADGSWTPWWNLGGGLNASDVEVKLVEAIPSAGALRFEMVSEGKRGVLKPVKGPRGRHIMRQRRPRRKLASALPALPALPACGACVWSSGQKDALHGDP